MPFVHRVIKGPDHSGIPLLRASIAGDVSEVKGLLGMLDDFLAGAK